MNSKLDFLFGRRSVRKYGAGEIPDDVVRDLLEAGMAAPSAAGKDPWRFVAVRDRATLARIAEGLPNGTFLREASLGIIVCGDPRAAHTEQESYMLQDCSASIENILLAVHALGLGACWLGVHPRPERMGHLRQVLGIPEEILPVAALAIGRPAALPEPRTRYEESSVHHERW